MRFARGNLSGFYRRMGEDDRLSRMDTLWSVVHRAHSDDEATIDVRAAREQLMNRYGGAARRYLLGALKNENDADEVYQEFSLRMIRGDFHRADPERGQFRKFVKTALFRMIVDYQRAARKRGAVLETKHEFLLPAESDPLGDEAFARKWRAELIEKTLDDLRSVDRKSGSHLYDVLHLRIANPKMRSPELAKAASQKVGKNITADNFRAILRRARVQFARLLLDKVTQSLTTPTPQELESELAELNLLEYCRPALDQD